MSVDKRNATSEKLEATMAVMHKYRNIGNQYNETRLLCGNYNCTV